MIAQTFTGRMASRPEVFQEDELQEYRDAAAQPGALTAMINYYRALLRGGGLKRLQQRGFPPIEVPTLLIWGEDDPILVPSILADADRWLKDKTLRTIARAGHWVQQEAPDEFNAILESWLLERRIQ